MSDYTHASREQAVDFMAEFPGFGEMRGYAGALDAEQLAFCWRQMPPDTGGRGSYGHRHKTQEEIYFVISGQVTFKVGDDVFEVGPTEAVRVAPSAYRSIHNDGEDAAELLVFSKRVDDPEADGETIDDFWPR